MTNRQLTSRDDILHAARVRLRGWKQADVEPVWKLYEDIRSRQQIPSAADVLAVLPDDGKDRWSCYCALQVLTANKHGDTELLFRAGYCVIDWYRQSERAKNRRERQDALRGMIADCLRESPDISPKALWDDFKRQAEDGFHPVLADFDENTDELLYAPSKYAESVAIGFEAFRKRVQQARRSAKK